MEKGTTMIELEARHVTKTYGNGQSPAVRDVNFTLQKGESVAIMGPFNIPSSSRRAFPPNKWRDFV